MRNYRLYVKDIFEAMGAVQAFVEGMGFDAFIAAEVNLDILPHLPINWKNWRSPAIIF